VPIEYGHELRFFEGISSATARQSFVGFAKSRLAPNDFVEATIAAQRMQERQRGVANAAPAKGAATA